MKKIEQKHVIKKSAASKTASSHSAKSEPKSAKPTAKPAAKPTLKAPLKAASPIKDLKTPKKDSKGNIIKPAAPPAKAPKPEKSKSGTEKVKKPSRPQKLVQVVPSHKPAHVIQAPPPKRERMLMRFGKPAKRVMFKVDFLLKASPTIVYHFITNPAALVRWFCDAVDITAEFYTFSWNGSTEVAELMDDIEDERLRFQWLDGEDEDEFFEFRLTTADITDETILEIYDFAWEDEVEDQKQLWRTQVDRLKKETGDQ